MRTRSVMILALVVLALGAWIYFVERHQPTTDERQERADRVFPDLDRDAVAAIEVEAPSSSVRLERRDGGWRITRPIDFPADDAKVGSVLSSLESLDVERELAADEVQPDAYGLDEAPVTVRLIDDDGSARELRVGDETPLGSKRAVSRGDAKVLITEGWFVRDLDLPLADWRSRDVVDVAAADLASVDVVAGGDRIAAVRSGDQWRLLEPVDDLADREHLRNLVADLDALRVEEFVDGDADLTEMGLADPDPVVTLVRDDDPTPVVLEFGAVRESDGGTTIACRRDGDDLFWVDDRAAIRLAKAPVRWRASRLYPFDTWNARVLEISTPSGSVHLEQADGTWTADGDEVDFQAVQERLRMLADAEAVDFDLLQPSTTELGSIRLELEHGFGDDATRQELRYAFFAPMAAGGNAAVTVSARTPVMTVDPETARELLGDLDALGPLPADATEDSAPVAPEDMAQ